MTGGRGLIQGIGMVTDVAEKVAKGVGKIVDPNRKLRRAQRKRVLAQAKLAHLSPQSLGLSEGRIKQEVGKAGENIQAQIGAGTRQALRNLQGQPGYQRGAQAKILAGAQQATARGTSDVESQLRSADAALELAQARGIEASLAQASKDLSKIRTVNMEGTREGQDTGTAAKEANQGIQGFMQAGKAMGGKYKE